MTTSVTTSLPPFPAGMMKPIWQSKTFWLNVLTIILAIISLIDPVLFNIDPKWLLLITGILNILIRFLTEGPVSLLGNQGAAKPNG